jgi:hypothetical protein
MMMPNRKRLLLTFLLSFVVVGCHADGNCGETVTQSQTSPDGLTAATVTVVNCGAMTRYSSYVSIQTTQIKLRDEGMLFGYNGKPQLQLVWTASNELEIRCADKCTNAKVYRQVTTEGQYHITYSGFDSLNH